MNDVYIDVLIFENTIMNYVILHITSMVMSLHTRWYRLLAGALTGAAYTVLSLWFGSFMNMLAAKILLSAAMVAVTFCPKKIKMLARISACFYVVTFLFAGISFALIFACSVKYTGNILSTVCIGYILIINVSLHIKKRRAAENTTADVFIQFDKENGAGVWLPAIVDSGNMLRDPFSGESVIVAELNAFENEIPCSLYDVLRKKGTDILNDASAVFETKGWENRFRIIPYSSVGNKNGILPGFKADIVRVSDKKNKNTELSGVIVCLYENTLSDDEQYRALLAPDMIA